MNISRNFAVICLFILILVTNACGGLTRSDKPAITRWWLKPYVAAAQATPAEPLVAVALSVTVVPGLDSDRILTLSNDAELGQFAAARWVDNLPELLNSLLERSLQATGRFDVSSDRAAARPDNCHLQLELREFFADIDPAGKTTGVRVAINGRFQCGSAAPVDIHSSAVIAVVDERMHVIVAAFQQAMDRVMQDILSKI